jgi:hypothetical protein
MARPRPKLVELRGAPPLETLADMSDEDLGIIETRSPGTVTTSYGTWHSSPMYCVTARRILTERGHYG